MKKQRREEKTRNAFISLESNDPRSLIIRNRGLKGTEENAFTVTLEPFQKSYLDDLT